MIDLEEINADFTKEKRLMCIVGKSGTGKDYVTGKIIEKYPNLKQTISRTTRKPRYEGESCHLFISEEQAIREKDSSLAYTFFHGNHYYVLEEDLMDSDIYIVDKTGVESLQRTEFFKKSLIRVIYLDVPWYILIPRLFNRDGVINGLKRFFHDIRAFRGMKEEADIVVSYKKADLKVIRLASILFNQK